MKIFAIGDLHLSFTGPVDPGQWDRVREHKSMGALFPVWQGHYRKLYEEWNAAVGREDTVLVPGDISWGMRLEDARPDLDFLGLLPGRLILIQGNHDYWWQSISRVRRTVPPNVQVIQNDHVLIGDVAVCGTRGWTCPSDTHDKEEDRRIYQRELLRLEMSLKSVPPGTARKIIVLMHYMPTNEKHERSGFIDILISYGVSMVVYGHLHAAAKNHRLPDRAWGISFHLVSADYLDFRPLCLDQLEGDGSVCGSP
ncbi:MAG TPA: metallophosphoesterase [Spirochaetia bacterium]|nr:metallophosphoesterase [Spirochaetia bacterium]